MGSKFIFMKVFVLPMLAAIAFAACKKEKPPPPAPGGSSPVVQPTNISTFSPNGIGFYSAYSGGEAKASSGDSIYSKGVCWDTITGPDLLKSHTLNGSGAGSFTSLVAGLLPGKTYFIRAYLRTQNKTLYGAEYTFKTPKVWQKVASALPYTSLLAIGSSIYGISTASLGLSTNEGASWKNINNNIGLSGISCLLLKGNVLFAGGNPGVKKSFNGGNSWLDASNGLDLSTSIRSLINENGTLYAGGGYNGVYKSIDDGTSWVKVVNGLPGNCFVFTLYAFDKTIYLGSNTGLYVSSDLGNNWTLSETGLPSSNGSSNPLGFGVQNNKVFVRYGNSGGVFYTVDKGLNWNLVNPCLFGNNTTTSFANFNETFYASSYPAGPYLIGPEQNNCIEMTLGIENAGTSNCILATNGTKLYVLNNPSGYSADFYKLEF